MGDTIMKDQPKREELFKLLSDIGSVKLYKLIDQYVSQKVIEGRIDTATDILYGYSRTYKQEVTDSEGNVYVNESHGYISQYEVQDLVARLEEELAQLTRKEE